MEMGQDTQRILSVWSQPMDLKHIKVLSMGCKWNNENNYSLNYLTVYYLINLQAMWFSATSVTDLFDMVAFPIAYVATSSLTVTTYFATLLDL